MSQALDLRVASLPELEGVIGRGLATFVEVGTALAEIRERRLYRDSHGDFDSYCRERWGFGRSYADRQIAAARVVAELPAGNQPSGSTEPLTPMGVIPANERQAREVIRAARTGPPTAEDVGFTQQDIDVIFKRDPVDYLLNEASRMSRLALHLRQYADDFASRLADASAHDRHWMERAVEDIRWVVQFMDEKLKTPTTLKVVR